MIKLSNIKAPVNYTNSALMAIVADALGTAVQNIDSIKLLKKSVDARKKNEIVWVLSVAVALKNEKAIKLSNFESYVPTKRRLAELAIDKKKSNKRIYVIGSGSAGLFAALTLATAGLKPILIERGANVDERTKIVSEFSAKGIFDPVTNIQFGEGGAGAFSDGKLNTGTSNDLIGIVFGEFVENGAPSEIEYLAHPHIGTDYLVNVVKNIRNRIIELGGEVRFLTKLTDIFTQAGSVSEIELTTNTGEVIREKCDCLLLATGHSARDTYQLLAERGAMMEQKPFAIGVRIEHLQADLNIAQYGADNKFLPPSEYKLSTVASDGRGVYTFCMCPGGVVVAATSEEHMVVTNGMSNFARSGKNANSAILVNIKPADFGSYDPLAGIEFQRKYERKAYEFSSDYRAPAQKFGDFLVGKATKEWGAVKPSYAPSVAPANLKECLPSYVYKGICEGVTFFDRKIRGFASKDAVLTGVETRSSSPVRILRNDNYESNIEGLYPIGEGAGYSGGITSSAVDGIKVALALITKI